MPAASPDLRSLLVCLCAAVACGESGPAAAPAGSPATRPSLLMIVSDTLRADALECYGGRARTPNICGLAARGVLFERAYSNAPWTFPSTVSLFSGSFASGQTRGEDGDDGRRDLYIADAELLLGEALAAEGYELVSFLENPLAGRPNSLQGFEDGETRQQVPIREELLPRLDPTDKRHRRLAGVLRYLLVVGDRDFFALKWFRDPHASYEPPPALVRQMDLDLDRLSHPLAWYLGLGHRGDIEGFHKLRDVQYELSDYEIDLLERLYLLEVESIDERVGYMLELLDQQRLRDRTLVVFTSDHGEGFGEHGRFLHGNSFYEELVRVPLILAGPGLPRDRRVRQPVSHVDLMPTLCEVMGVRCLENAQGTSFAALLRGEADTLHPRVQYLENPTAEREDRDALVEGSWKLIAKRPEGFELYDLAADPGERRDLAREKPDVVAHMQAAVEAIRQENEARRQRTLPPTDPEVLRRERAETERQLRELGYIE